MKTPTSTERKMRIRVVVYYTRFSNIVIKHFSKKQKKLAKLFVCSYGAQVESFIVAVSRDFLHFFISLIQPRLNRLKWFLLKFLFAEIFDFFVRNIRLHAYFCFAFPLKARRGLQRQNWCLQTPRSVSLHGVRLRAVLATFEFLEMSFTDSAQC